MKETFLGLWIAHCKVDGMGMKRDDMRILDLQQQLKTCTENAQKHNRPISELYDELRQEIDCLIERVDRLEYDTRKLGEFRDR